MLAATLLLLIPQDPAAAAPGAAHSPVAVRVALAPRAPGEAGRLGWSPKGATVPLTAADDVLRGAFRLGPATLAPVQVELSRSPGAAHFDRLAIDLDRDGAFADDERLTTQPKDQRGKWWSSFSATVQVPFAADAAPVPYPLNLWFVADPSEPDAAPALRWSRGGWHEGSAELDGRPALVMITELAMDGVFTTADSWMLARDRKALLGAGSRGLRDHVWLDGVAYRVVDVAADGSHVQIESFLPSLSEAEERERADVHKADREAKRAAAPLAFGKDLPAALVEAASTGKRVFVDFETTWCGPCKQMDQLVYTAADVVGAAASVIAVKLDGDEQKELVKRYEVKGYPTLLLLDADGKVLRREVGYQSVARMVKFFAP